MKEFQLTSKYKPTGDQPEAIRQLSEGVLQGVPAQKIPLIIPTSVLSESGEEGMISARHFDEHPLIIRLQRYE